MGCVSSKRAVSVAAASPVSSLSPQPTLSVVDRGSAFSSRNPSGTFECEQRNKKDRKDGGSKHHRKEVHGNGSGIVEGLVSGEMRKANSKKLKKGSSRGTSGSIGFKFGFSHSNIQAEQIAAGWPSWLSSAAAEAIQGWIPLRAEAYEKLEKIGQGTYSSVFRAREVETERMVALKKVRFDNFQAESIRFMAREIMILRRLDHPNIMKLEGIITSRLSSSIYLVFEYMEHDLAGLVSHPEINFTESQIKCYMRQLLRAIEHCHLRAIMHRDIKVSNILVNNEGVLKLGDFGLANVLNSRNRQQLTSRVVTLWYRPPELLMGSTSYGVSVDLWSVGCVFAELLIVKPILKGRTEVEQLHKIFKLCGSPPDEFWRRSNIPNATMFRPQHPYESTLRERCKYFPPSAVDMLETFLSIDPEKRGTASSALISEYFNTVPYACDPSSLPKYPPSKEMDAKLREEARRKKPASRMRDSGIARKPRRVHRILQQQNSFNKYAPKEEMKSNSQEVHRLNDSNAIKAREGLLRDMQSSDTISETSQASKGEYNFTGPPPVIASSGFAWAKKRKEDTTSTLSYDPSISSSQLSALDSSTFNFANSSFDLTSKGDNGSRGSHQEIGADHLQKLQNQFDPAAESLNGSKLFHSCDASAATQEAIAPRSKLDYSNQREKVEFSGPLLSQSYQVDAILQRNESQIRRAARRSRMEREM